MTGRTLIARAPLAWFYAIALAIAWPAFALYASGVSVALQFPLLLLGSYAPAIASILLYSLPGGPSGRTAFRRRVFGFRVPVRWYLLAIAVPSISCLVAIISVEIISGGLEPVWTNLLLLPLIFFTNYGEEVGWRGLALPALLGHFRPATASLVLGVGWAIFHIPVYWSQPLTLLLFSVLILPISLLLTWLYLRTGGSVPICTLFHATLNTWVQALLAESAVEIPFLLLIIVLTAIASLVIALGGLKSVGASSARESTL